MGVGKVSCYRSGGSGDIDEVGEAENYLFSGLSSREENANDLMRVQGLDDASFKRKLKSSKCF